MRYIIKTFITVLVLMVSVFSAAANSYNAIVADSTSRMPLPSASIFDCKGKVVGICNTKGKMPYVSPDCYPISIRYLGFENKIVSTASSDTIFLQENLTTLPEVVVSSHKQEVMHLLAYVREYSTLSTYTDTIFMFREKMVDYILNPNNKIHFNDWSTPRVLNSKSYYHFTNAFGLDSVSRECNQHFSWSDWVGIASAPAIPPKLRGIEQCVDTIRGKYSPTEVWIKNGEKVTIDVDVLADTTSRKWVANLSAFFRKHLDFTNFMVRFHYDDVAGDSISPINLNSYSFNIDSNGRGRKMFMFNHVDEPFAVSTYAEVYMIDKEFITTKEAKKWENRKFGTTQMSIYEPSQAPSLQPAILTLVERVNNINENSVRLNYVPDHRMMGRRVVKQNIGQRILQLLKTTVGISDIKANKKREKEWKDMTTKQAQENKI